jgi:hypothetical protein
MHNANLEHASITSILKPFEKKFLKKQFSRQISSKPQVLKRWSKKRGREIKAPRVFSNKGEVNILSGERQFNFKNPFQCDPIFSPASYHLNKPFPKSWRKFS